jgi:hypothetical protein
VTHTPRRLLYPPRPAPLTARQVVAWWIGFVLASVLVWVVLLSTFVSLVEDLDPRPAPIERDTRP